MFLIFFGFFKLYYAKSKAKLTPFFYDKPSCTIQKQLPAKLLRM